MPSAPSQRLQIVIDEELQARIKAAAKANQRTTSAEIRVALIAWCNQQEQLHAGQ